MAFLLYVLVITHFETNNKYDIKNNANQMVYFVTEDTDDYTRNAYRTLRPFVLRVTDFMGREIMTMQRPFRCTCCCFCCPSARQEVREWKSNLLFSSWSKSLQNGCALSKLYRTGFSVAVTHSKRRLRGGINSDHLTKEITEGFLLWVHILQGSQWIKHKLGLCREWQQFYKLCLLI